MILLIILIALVLGIRQSKKIETSTVHHHHVHPPTYIVNGREVSYEKFRSVYENI